jgi:hypothetical protein
MHAQRNVVNIASRRTLNPPTHTRRELRGNVIQWRADAKASRTIPVPRPGEDGTPELIPTRRQNLWLAALGTIALLVVGTRFGGLL